MNNRKKAVYINVVVVLVCLLLTILIYIQTGQIFFAILIAPPVIYWILEKRSDQNIG